MRFFLIALLFVVSACGGETQPLTLEEQVAALSAEHKYEEAIRLLKTGDTSEPAIQTMLAKTHLAYGIHMLYEDNSMSMRDKVVSSLRQFIDVLKLEPENEKAHAEIDQIMGVYQTMPGRTLPADIIDALKGYGLDGGMQADTTDSN